MIKQIPNLFTLLNLIFGCVAIILCLQPANIIVNDAIGEQAVELPEQMYLASFCIIAAAVIDFFDGFIARLLKADSAMGKQLDSLADVVSFGVAPSVIVYQFLKNAFAQQQNGLNVSFWLLLPAFFIAAAGAYRLARFNIDNSQSIGFKGIPIPAAGLLIASFPVISFYNQSAFLQTVFTNVWFWYSTIAAVSYLMVSTLPMIALKFKQYSWKGNEPTYSLIILSVATIGIFKWLGIPIIFLMYVAISLLFKPKKNDV